MVARRSLTSRVLRRAIRPVCRLAGRLDLFQYNRPPILGRYMRNRMPRRYDTLKFCERGHTRGTHVAQF